MPINSVEFWIEIIFDVVAESEVVILAFQLQSLPIYSVTFLFVSIPHSLLHCSYYQYYHYCCYICVLHYSFHVSSVNSFDIVLMIVSTGLVFSYTLSFSAPLPLVFLQFRNEMV